MGDHTDLIASLRQVGASITRQAADALEAATPSEKTLRDELAKYDAIVAACPANKTHLGEKLCPNCKAGPNEGCRREILAAYAFINVARTALTEQEKG